MERRAIVEGKETGNAERAAEKMADAVEKFARHVDRLTAPPLRPLPLPEEEADELAERAVHRARMEIGRDTEDHAPRETAIREWVEKREEYREAGRSLPWRH